jgi:hypothetical protein
MTASNPFKVTIQSYLEQYATTDELFSDKLKNPVKNIDDCITYILNTVQKSGCNGFADVEIFNIATHYYDEDKIEVGKPISGKVVVNHHVEITEEEKAEIKQKAVNEIIAEEKRKMMQKKSPTSMSIIQGGLFDSY